MEYPSPFKSRPHSAATTPKIPVRSSTIDQAKRKTSKNHDVENFSPRGEEELYELSDIKESYSAEAVKTSTPKGERASKENESNETSEKNAANRSEFEEREFCCTYKIRNSFVLCCGFLCFGASMAILGPTILEMGCLIGNDVGSMSWVFFSQSCSALVGAICSGFIIDRYVCERNSET